MKKNRNNKHSNKFPFANEIQELKYGFKKMVDDMPDEEFIDFLLLFTDFIEEIDDAFDDFEYEELEDFDSLPF